MPIPEWIIRERKCKWILIALAAEAVTGRTGDNSHAWLVLTKKRQMLGSIIWYGPFGKYSFQPTENSIYECDCLRDIAQFCEDQTAARKAKYATQS